MVRLLTVRDLQQAWRYSSPKQVYRDVESGLIPRNSVVRLGRRLRFLPEVLDEFAKAGGTRPLTGSEAQPQGSEEPDRRPGA